MSVLRPLINTYLRRIEKPRMRRATGPEPLRRSLELQAKWMFYPPRGTQQQWQVLDADGRRVEALEAVPRTLKTPGVLLYIHGGGFVFGSPRTHVAMAAHLGQRLGARVVLPRYRLAPENVFPAAPQDVRTAWDSLIASGIRPEHIVVGGDSAGGALALGLLAALCAENAPMPGGVFCFSPLTDLTYSSESFRTNRQREVFLVAERAHELGQMYLAGQVADDPAVSPLFANFRGACPVWLTVGDTEILLDDSRRMAKVLASFGADVTLEERHDLPHVWPILHNLLPEGRQTLESVAAWIRRLPGWPSES